ncbi:MAG TPA: hypothetical protein VF502_16675 [Stellaceae bacterium]
MRRIGKLFLALVLGACSMFAIADRYGNQYGDWYNPGEGYRWQFDACDRQVEQQNLPPTARKLAMRCCMRDHGVPIGDPQDCRG